MPMPLPYSPSYEQPEANEPELLAKLQQTFMGVSNKTYEDTKRGLRGAHAKTHVIIKGELTVADNLPPELAQGLFAKPGRYETVLRLSTAPGDILPDAVSTIRGLALKIIGVDGERLPGSEADRTQDFLMVNGPTFQNKNAATFLRDSKPVAATADKVTWLKKLIAMTMRGLERVVEAMGGKGNKIRLFGGQLPTHPLGECYFTQLPHLYGQYYGKLSLAPVSSSFTSLAGREIDIKAGDDPLRQAIRQHFLRDGGEWELRVQLATDSERMPIENAAKDWPQAESPYRAIARLKVLPQTAWEDGASTKIADRLSFSPWHGLAAHRPLGSLMRIRKAVYEVVSKMRQQRNGVPHREPTSLDKIFGTQQKTGIIKSRHCRAFLQR